MQFDLRFLASGLMLVVSLVGCADSKAGPSADESKKDSSTAVGQRPSTGNTDAEQGVGYGENVPLLQPASVYWKARKQLTQEILIPKAVQMFEALNGRKPASHSEFMDKIIRENRIPLPKLDAGLEYFYDPEQEELLVRRIEEASSSERSGSAQQGSAEESEKTPAEDSPRIPPRPNRSGRPSG